MANIFWNVTASGNWNTQDDWNTDTIPGAGDDAVLGVTGFAISDAYTVTVTTAIDVDSVAITDTGAVLSLVSPGTLTVATTLTNAGDIELQYAVAMTVMGDFTNTSIINLDTQTDLGLDPAGGSALTIGGTLTNSGTMNIGNGGLASETEVSAAALANTGSINLTGNTSAGDTQQAVLDITSAAPTTWTGSVSLSGQSLLEFASGSIGTIAAGAVILVGTDQGYVADAGALTSNSALTGLDEVDGTFNLEFGATVALAGNLDVVGSLDADTTSNYGDTPSGGSDLTIAGTLTNSGGIYIGNAFFSVGGLTATSTISAAALVNTGTIVLYGNTSAGDTKQAILDIAAAAPTIWAGSLTMYGQALLEYGSGSIGTIAQGAEIYLATDEGYIADSGATTSNSALTGLTDIAGDFELQYGPSVSLSGGLTVTGSLNVDTQTDYSDDPSGGSTLTIAGTLTNSGTVSIGNYLLTGPTTVSAAALVNTGSIIFNGNYTPTTRAPAALDISSAAPTIWTGYVALNGEALLEYGSGSIGTIAAGAQIYLSTDDGYIADAGTLTSNSALSGLTEIDGGLNLEFGATVDVTGNLDVIGYLDVDTTSNYGDNPSGGSDLMIGGTLTNGSGIYIGNAFFSYGGDTATSTISAAALVNTGTIVLFGNSGAGDTKQAVLDIAAAAPTIWQGHLTLEGQALLEYGSGSIGTIAQGAAINLDTNQGYIADAGTTTANSALTGLTEIDGYFEQQSAPPVSLSGNLTVTNTGSLNIDTTGGTGGSMLTIAGTLTNSNSIDIGNGGLSAPTTVSAGALVNTGSIGINGNGPTDLATLDIAAAAPTIWTGQISLTGAALLEYGSGSIGTIAAGAEIYLAASDAYIADAGTTTSDSALTGLTDVAGNFSVEFGASVTLSADLTVTGFLGVDDHILDGFDQSGGSTLVIGGTLTNNATVSIGNYELTGPTFVSAAALVNTGTITIQGNNAVGTALQAVLDVAAAAPTTWTGALTMYGQSLLEYGSGSIGTIAAGSDIFLGTSDGYIADAGATTSNSALTGLTDVAGSFSMEYGASVTLSADLLVTGFLGVDNYVFDGFNQSGGSTLVMAGTLTNTGTVDLGNYELTAPALFSAGSIDNENILDATGGGSYALTLTDSGALTNAGTIGFGNNVIASFAALTNSGRFGVSGNYGAPSTVSVNGAVSNTGTMTIGAYAEIGVTGAFTDSGTLNVGGVVDVAAGLEVTNGASLVMQDGQIITPDAASLTIDTGATVSGDGVLSLAVANSGSVTASGGLLDIAGPITGGGALNIAAGSELELGGATAETVGFNGNIGTLKLDQPASFTGAVTGLVEGDTIDLAGVDATSAIVTNGTLTVTAGAQTYTYQVSGPGLASNSFALEDDQQGGTDLVLGPAGPVISGPMAQTAFLGFPSLFGPLTITDPNAGSGLLTVTITAVSGVLAGTAANAGTLTGNGTNELVLTGDLADINTMLAGIAYLGAAAGSVDDVRVVVTDAGSATAAQTIAVTTDTVPFTLPLLNAPVATVVIPGVPTGIAGISVSDPYAQSNGTPVTVTFTASGIAESLAASGTGGTVTGQDSGDLSITGSLLSTNSYFADGVTNLILADAVAKAQADAEKAGEEYKDIVGDLNFLNTFIGEGLFAAVAETAQDDLKEAAGVPEPPDLGQTLVEVDVGLYSFSANVLNDVAALASGATSLPPAAGSGGKPWFTTFDGLLYQLDVAGGFILAESTQPGDSFQVQVALQPVSGSASTSEITQIAAQVGSMTVTFVAGRASFVWVNGAPASVGPSSPEQLGGGELTQPGPETYVITWNTGETLTVVDDGSYLDLSVALAANEGAGSVQGLLGTDSGQANDFTEANGTVLQQPLTSAQLAAFADSWQVTSQNTLFDGGATFNNPSFPTAAITLADLPANVVALAAAAVSAAGITNAAEAAAAEFDFIASGGDPSIVAADASAFQGDDATAASVTPGGTAPAELGIFAPVADVQAAQSGTTAVTFDVYLTAAVAADTEVDYAVIAPNADDFDAADFGGILPSGSIVIAAGQTTGIITIDVPEDALGDLPSADVDVQISTPGSVPIFAPTSVEAVDATAPTAPTVSELAVPLLEYLGDFGTFSQSGNDYTLNLGEVQFGEKLPDLLFGIANTATGAADALGGTITWATVEGFDVSVDGATTSGAALPSIAAGTSVQALTVSTVQDKFGGQTETITFDPTDTNSSGYSSSLAPITLTISDTLEVPGTITSQAWGDVHIITYNNLQYNFQEAGEFILAESEVPGDTFQIQLRLQPYTDSASVTFITQVAIQLGADGVTFDAGAVGQPPTIRVGTSVASLSMADPTLILSGGTITEVSPDLYKVVWNTGETMTVTETDTFEGFNYFNVTDSVPYAAEGSVMGLQGENEGAQNDFQLPDGTVLQQPLTSAEFTEYANAWRVPEAATLFYYDPNLDQSWQTFAHPDFPTDPLTLADIPASVVAQAAALVAAAGITDPTTAADAELDYIVTGDPNTIAAAQDVQEQVTSTVAATIPQTSQPTIAIGAIAKQPVSVAAASGATPVTFTVYLTAAASTDTVVDYAIIYPDAGDINPTLFSGTWGNNGYIKIGAGQTTGQFTIDVPQGVLGTQPDENLDIQVSSPDDAVPVVAPTAETELVNDQPEPGNPPDPILSYLGTVGTFTFDADTNTYTLDLSGVAQNAVQVASKFKITSSAPAPSDELGGTFTAPSGTGFTVFGDSLPTPLAAGADYDGLSVTDNTAVLGTHKMSVTFDPVDENASGYSAALTPLTLDIVDDVTPPAQGALNTPGTIIFPNVHVGATDSQSVSVTNTAASGSENLDVSVLASGSATATGTITLLAPGQTDASSIVAGIDTSTAGALNGQVSVYYVSDPGDGGTTSPTPTDDPTIDVFGDVYRLAAPSVPSGLDVHIGASGDQSLVITNTDPNDGYSENLIATVVGTTGAVTASGTTGDIVAQKSGTIAVDFTTATAGSIGTVTLDLESDGTGIDGLGMTNLGDVTVPVSVTGNNYADAELVSSNGTLTQPTQGNYVLNLGTVVQNSGPVAISLAALNAALAPADDIDGSYSISGDAAFTNTGFGAFSDVAAGAQSAASTVALDTGSTGSFSETITFDPTDSNAQGFSESLPAETVTVEGTVAPPTGIASGDVHLTMFDGLDYDFQALGDFTLARSTVAGDSFLVQIQTTPFANIAGTSVVTEAAARVGGDVVTFGMGGPAVAINGIADTALSAANPTQLLDGGTLQMISATQYQLSWSSGETLTVSQGWAYLNVTARLGSQDAPGSVQGLLGSDTGQANDFALPDGTVLKQPVSSTTLLGQFADAWTVAPGQSLLGGTALVSSGLGAPPAMTFLAATAPGQVLTGSLEAGGQTGTPVTMVGALADFSGDTVMNFAAQDLIDVTNVGSALATLATTGDVLTIGTGSASAALHLSGDLSGSVFHAVSDQHGGTLISLAA